MTFPNLMIVVLCVFLETVEQLAYNASSVWSRRKLWLSLGITCHMIGLGLWFWLLTFIPLGVAVPLMGANYITVAFASQYLFHEKVTPVRWMGIACIVLGLMMVWSYELK
ncbi:MAG: EamA family transporter [Cyanobacteria bacterium]|nr:EamA family transporter [Cyanobacteriota bacterium]